MNKMRLLIVVLIAIVAMTTLMKRYAPVIERAETAKMDFVYSNESFSITIPKEWGCDDSKWSGPADKFHGVNIYNKYEYGAWINIVRSSIKVFDWQSPERAAILSTELKELPPDEARKYGIEQDTNYIGVDWEEDSIDVGGYPAHLTVYMYKAEGDTLINCQLCVLIPDDNQLYYVNQNIYYSTMDMNPQLGYDCYDIIKTIKFKRNDMPEAVTGIIVGSINEFYNMQDYGYNMATPDSTFTDDASIAFAMAQWLTKFNMRYKEFIINKEATR